LGCTEILRSKPAQGKIVPKNSAHHHHAARREMNADPSETPPRTPLDAPPSAARLIPAIELSAVYRMRDPDEADAILGGQTAGFVYARDGHPNGADLAARCKRLHAADEGCVCGSGMGALAAAVLALVEHGQEIVLSDQLYGKSVKLLTTETARLGIRSRLVDTSDLAQVEAALESKPRMLVCETISNPNLRVADLPSLASLSKASGTLLLVDNTFATPAHCQPLRWGADIVHESITKMMNGHSDVILGFLGGARKHWERVPNVISTWGLAASPFDCWLAMRGLGTLAVRMERASANALAVAEYLAGRSELAGVAYPGLRTHPDHELAKRLLKGGFGSMVTFTLRGGRDAATRFIRAVSNTIPFAPSLGDLSTTLSHPESTSHRALTPDERTRLGIDGGTIRLSVGIETADEIISALQDGLQAIS
jgi:cystathionine beta-lyase/cystathionine gamma-synthase